MRKSVLAAAAAVLAGFGYMAFAAEEKVALDKVPAPVMEAFKKRFPKAEAKEAAKEEEKGKTVYEIEMTDGGVKHDVTFTPEGVLVGIEKVIPAKDLPKAVTDAVEAKYPKATYKMAEEVTKVTDGKEAVAYYETLIVTADKKTLELEVYADGKIKNTEEKKDERK